MSEMVFIKINESLVRFSFDEILYIEARGNHSMWKTLRGNFDHSLSLNAVMDQLNRSQFIRVHRSYVINLNRVDSIVKEGVKISDDILPINKKARMSILRRIRHI